MERVYHRDVKQVLKIVNHCGYVIKQVNKDLINKQIVVIVRESSDGFGVWKVAVVVG